jgi:uncharacterized protein
MGDPARLASIVVGCGFILGFAFGAILQRTQFCTMGAVSDIVNIGDWGRMRMWLLAIAVAIAGANALDVFGWVDLSRSAYPAPRWPWLAHVLGGGLFGIGMTLASGCSSRSLARMAGGSVKATVAIACLAVAAEMTLRGPFAPARDWLAGAFSVRFDQGQDLSWLIASPLGIGKRGVQVWLSVAIVVALLAFAFRDRVFRGDRERVIGGVALGLLVVGGWYVTGHLGFIAEHPDTLQEAYVGTRTARPESFTYIGPAANALELLQVWKDKPPTPTFGVAVFLGTLIGALAQALWSRRFRWQGFVSAGDFASHVIGGFLMGFGGVTAMGCTIGQGMTGLSTLALGSFVVFFSIIAAAAMTIKAQFRMVMRGG